MAKRSLGTKLLIGEPGVPIGELTSISSPSITQETIDVTNLNSAGDYRDFIGGFKDGGEVTASGFFAPDDPGQQAVWNALATSSTEKFKIEFPTEMGASWEFNGVVTGFQTNAELEEAISFEITIKVAGEPTLTLPTTGT